MPRLAILVGIAAGMKSEVLDGISYKGVKIGTILVPDRILDFSNAVVELGEDLKTSENFYRSDPLPLRPLPGSIDYSLQNGSCAAARKLRDAYLRQHYPDWGQAHFAFKQPATSNLTPIGWEEFVSKYVEKDIAISDKVIASSNLLLKNPVVLRGLQRQKDDRVRAGDMESAGLAKSSEMCDADWLVIRGVSDFGDRDKSDQFHHLASANAAAYLRVFLTSKLTRQLDVRPDKFRALRVERFEKDAKAILESFATLFKDSLGINLNLEIYWVGKQVNVHSGKETSGVVRHGEVLKAERAGGLNRNEPRIFFPFEPEKGEARAVAKCGKTGESVFHRASDTERTPLRWVYASPIHSIRNGARKVEGVLCCTSTEDHFAESGPDPATWKLDLLRFKAITGVLGDLLTKTFESNHAYELVTGLRKVYDYRVPDS